MNLPPPGGRLRAYLEFILALLYFLIAKVVARRAVLGFSLDSAAPLAEQAVLTFLLIFGFAVMGFVLDRQTHPVAAQGWPLRSGWTGEAGLGLAIGWGLAVACILPLTLIGGIAIRFAILPSAWGWLAIDAAFFACAALAEEVAFRGYAFQRFAAALGGLGAALAFAMMYGILQSMQAGTSSASIGVSVAFSLLLSIAYLRTRALWLSWGLNFAWKASRGLLFGLALSGDNSHSPIVQGDPMGPFWLTGGGFGLDGTWLTCAILLAAIPVVFRVTRELDFRWNAPVIVSGGIPVDLDAATRRQHEVAMGPPASAAPALVQILPAEPPLVIQPAEAAPAQATIPDQTDSY